MGGTWPFSVHCFRKPTVGVSILLVRFQIVIFFTERSASGEERKFQARFDVGEGELAVSCASA